MVLTGCTNGPKGSPALINEAPISSEDNNTKGVVALEEKSPEKEGTIGANMQKELTISEVVPTEQKVAAKRKNENQPEIKIAPQKRKAAEISFDETVHEFGEINEGDEIRHEFKFKNIGNAPLNIQDVQVSCGCTMPTYPIMPIGPGEEGRIGVLYNSKGKFGTQKPSITIRTNATQRLTKLYLSGSIKHIFEQPLPADSTIIEKN